MNRGNRRGNRRRGRQNNSRGRVVLRRDFQGSIPIGSFDPPRAVTSPWNTLVVSATSTFEEAGFSQLKVSSVVQAIQTQLGFANTQKMYLRMTRVDIWSTVSDAVIGPLSFAVEPADLISATTARVTYRQWIEDIGTPARPAHVHFVWSRPEQEVVFTSDTDADIILLNIDHSATFACYWHIHVLWRVFGGNPISMANRIVLDTIDRSSGATVL